MRLTKKFARRFVISAPVIIRTRHRYLGIGAEPRGAKASPASKAPRENDNAKDNPHTSRRGAAGDRDRAVRRRRAKGTPGPSRPGRYQRTTPQLERRLAPAIGAIRLLVALFGWLLGTCGTLEHSNSAASSFETPRKSA